MGVPSKCDGAPMRFFWRGIDAIETIETIETIDAIDAIDDIDTYCCPVKLKRA